MAIRASAEHESLSTEHRYGPITGKGTGQQE
jgi:hypothetical protein